MSKKKILFIHHAAGWGGAPINMINILKGIDRKKYSAHVLLLKDSIVSKKLKENHIPFSVAKSAFYRKYYLYFSHSLPGYTHWYRLLRISRILISWIFSRYFFADKELKYFDYDIVHLNSLALTDWLKPCKKRAKVILHVQEPISKGVWGVRYQFIRKQIYKYADNIIAISKDNARRLGISKKTEVVYNFTNITETVPNPENYKSHKVLYVGGYSAIKGFYTLVGALDQIKPEIQIVILGTIPNLHRLKNRIKSILPFYRKKYLQMLSAAQKIKKRNNVIQVGMVEDIGPYLEECCCLVSPFSIEHFSRPAIEAFACAKPVIATDVEGTDEIIEHGTNGLLVDRDNPLSLAQAINMLAGNPEMCLSYGNMGYKLALDKFSDKNIRQIEFIYDQLCG